jgi:uncharacterized protein (DUF433 family)
MEDQPSRITINPEVCHGKPIIRGLRYPVGMVLDLLSAGMSTTDILADYNDLEPADITAVLQYAAQLALFNGLRFCLHEDAAGCPAASIAHEAAGTDGL